MRREVTEALAPIAYHQGRPDDAWTQVRSLLPEGVAAEPGSRCYISALLLQRFAADLALDAGQPKEARAWLEANDRWLDWSGSILGRAENRAVWARFHRATGDLLRAVTMADQAVRAANQPHQPLALLAACRLRGELAVVQGRSAAAERELSGALALANACAAPFERALTLVALAELHAAAGQPTEAAGRLAEARAICEPLEARPTLARIDALAARLAGMPAEAAVFAGLTERERQILRLLAEGPSDREIAERLSISPKTVGVHVSHILAKLDVPSRAAAVAYAVRHGLV